MGTHSQSFTLSCHSVFAPSKDREGFLLANFGVMDPRDQDGVGPKKKKISMFPRTGIEPVTFRLYDDPLQPNVISNYTIEGLIAEDAVHI